MRKRIRAPGRWCRIRANAARVVGGTALAVLLAGGAEAQAGLESRFFDSDGVRLHYIDEGRGEPVLLIHGLAANLDLNWVRPSVMSALVDAAYRVVAYDARGHGRSEKLHDPSRYGSPEVLDALRLLDHLDISRAHVVGYSRGGRVANQLRAEHPDRVRSVILGGYAESGRRKGKEHPAVEGPSRADVADALARGDPGPLLRRSNPDATTEEVEALSRILADHNDLRAVAAALRADRSFAQVTEGELRGNEVPSLLLVGELDRRSGEARAMARVMSNAEVLVVPGAGHVQVPERPEFVTAVLGFLARHRNGYP